MNVPALEFAELLEEGIAHHRAGRLPQAVSIYASILDAVPNHADALHLMGLAAHQFGQKEQALTLLTLALQSRPDIAGFHNSRGVVLAALKRTAEAIQEFRQALRLDPQCQDARKNLAAFPPNTQVHGKEPELAKKTISERGYWLSDDGHWFDPKLAAALCQFFAGKTVADFGAGSGAYVAALNAVGISCRGFDGNPATAAIPHCEVADLSLPLQVGQFDWVLSLEVGEHIPLEHEAVFLDNLDRHNRQGIVLSWAVEGQPGKGHINCRNNAYIKARLAKRGYQNDWTAEANLRHQSELWWFRHTLMVFRRSANGETAQPPQPAARHGIASP